MSISLRPTLTSHDPNKGLTLGSLNTTLPIHFHKNFTVAGIMYLHVPSIVGIVSAVLAQETRNSFYSAFRIDCTLLKLSRYCVQQLPTQAQFRIAHPLLFVGMSILVSAVALAAFAHVAFCMLYLNDRTIQSFADCYERDQNLCYSDIGLVFNSWRVSIEKWETLYNWVDEMNFAQTAALKEQVSSRLFNSLINGQRYGRFSSVHKPTWDKIQGLTKENAETVIRSLYLDTPYLKTVLAKRLKEVGLKEDAIDSMLGFRNKDAKRSDSLFAEQSSPNENQRRPVKWVWPQLV